MDTHPHIWSESDARHRKCEPKGFLFPFSGAEKNPPIFYVSFFSFLAKDFIAETVAEV